MHNTKKHYQWSGWFFLWLFKAHLSCFKHLYLSPLYLLYLYIYYRDAQESIQKLHKHSPIVPSVRLLSVMPVCPVLCLLLYLSVSVWLSFWRRLIDNCVENLQSVFFLTITWQPYLFLIKGSCALPILFCSILVCTPYL